MNGASSTISKRAADICSLPTSYIISGRLTYDSNPYHKTNNPEGIVNLGSAENKICREMIMSKLQEKYPIESHMMNTSNFRGLKKFRKQLASFLKKRAHCDFDLDSDDISVLNGTTSSVSVLGYTLGNEGEYYLAPKPTYRGLDEAMENYGGLNRIEVDLDNSLQYSSSMFEEAYNKAVSERKKVMGILLINPQNPTGLIFPKNNVIEILNFAKERQLHVMLDEIYMLSVYEGRFDSCLSYSAEWPDPLRTHCMWGFAKDFGMAGMRCAAIISLNPAVHRTIARLVGYYHMVPGTVQSQLGEILDDEEWLDNYFKTNYNRLRKARDIVLSHLKEVGVTCVPPRFGLFVWADFSSIFRYRPHMKESLEIFQGLISSGVYIYPGVTEYGGARPEYFRILYSVDEDELKVAMNRLMKFLKQYKVLNYYTSNMIF